MADITPIFETDICTDVMTREDATKCFLRMRKEREKEEGAEVLSFGKRYELGLQFVEDANISDDREMVENSSDCFYFVKDVDEVAMAFANELQLLTNVHDNSGKNQIDKAIKEYFEGKDDIGKFLDYYGIEWE